jgi:hypothetical protein
MQRVVYNSARTAIEILLVNAGGGDRATPYTLCKMACVCLEYKAIVAYIRGACQLRKDKNYQELCGEEG